MLDVEHITLACTDPDELAEFWLAVVDGERWGLPSSFDEAIVERPGGRADLLFREAPKGTERDLPIHLDLSTEDREGTVDRLRGLGASVRETKTETVDGRTATWTVMEDPEGNGFCVYQH